MVAFDFSLQLPSVYIFKSLQTSVFKVFPIIKYRKILKILKLFILDTSHIGFSPAMLLLEKDGDFTFLPGRDPKLNFTKMLCLH